MRLLIAGDLTLQDRAARTNWSIDALQKAFGSVKNIAEGCDYAIVNLESPVTECNKAIVKDGPSLKNLPSVKDIIKYCGFDIVTLANNHLKDYGSQGVLDTIAFCQKNGLQTIGAGKNLDIARGAIVLEDSRGFKIGLLNVCEHESSIATTIQAGSNPLDITNLYYDIKALKETTDKVVVIVHGGREHYQLPTPRMKREYHLIADFGADVIVNHHQHCYSGYEMYNNKPIFYGLGNFFFDRPGCRNGKWNQGLLLQLEVGKNRIDFQLTPYEQCNEEAVVKVLPYDIIKEKIVELNGIIVDDLKLESAFEKLVLTTKPLAPFLPFGNKVLRSLYYRDLLPNMFSKKIKAMIENSVSCETHREVLLHYLNNNLHNE